MAGDPLNLIRVMPAKGVEMGHDDDSAAGDMVGHHRSQGFVDYDRVADCYRQGRALPDEVLDRWAAAVRPYLKPGPLRVADVGAGTGIFAAAWPVWTTATVVAVEASAAMIRAADRDPATVWFVQGAAEALPLPATSIDVVWVSTALHHFGDVRQAIGEFARVLGDDGLVLVRTYAPGHTEVGWAAEFPGRESWEARFHSVDQLVSLFEANGFALADLVEVLEWTETYAASARWVERMRSADSMLTALDDREISAGLAALCAAPATIARLELTLFVFVPNRPR